MKILLGISGSIAAKLGPKMVDKLVAAGHEVRVVLTDSANNFLPLDGPWFADDIEVLTDGNEWDTYEEHSRVLHVDLVKWCDVFLIAPCTANTLAKIANGICDNLLTCCFRALPEGKPVLIAPAMNTQMWNHPITSRQLKGLFELGVYMVDPIEKTLYCGDTGKGAMADIEDIVRVAGIIKKRHDAGGHGEAT